MNSIIAIICCACLLLVWYLISKCQKYDLKELFIKIGISVLFVVVALIATLKSNTFSLFHILVITGLLLGLIGDILLDLKYVDKERTVGYSYGGFIVFGIGHILYMIAIIMHFYNGKILFIISSLLSV